MKYLKEETRLESKSISPILKISIVLGLFILIMIPTISISNLNKFGSVEGSVAGEKETVEEKVNLEDDNKEYKEKINRQEEKLGI